MIYAKVYLISVLLEFLLSACLFLKKDRDWVDKEDAKMCILLAFVPVLNTLMAFVLIGYRITLFYRNKQRIFK